MKHFLAWVLLICWVGTLGAQSHTIPNVQIQMVGSRFQSLGGANPVIADDITGVMINPAAAGVEATPFAMSTQKVLGAFDYKFYGGSFGFDIPSPFIPKAKLPLIISLAYGSVGLDNIPETTKDGSTFRQISSFTQGFDVFQVGASSQVYDMFGFNVFSAGASAKMVRESLASRTRSGIGIDFGGIGTYYLSNLPIEKLHVGASIQNLLSTSMSWKVPNSPTDTTLVTDEAQLPLSIFIGARADLMDDQLSLFIHNTNEGLAVGSEYYLLKTMALRGSTNLKTFSLGTGLLFENIGSGIGERDYSIRLDTNYTQNVFPFESDPNYSLSISVLGETRPKAPQILVPGQETTTREKTIKITGVGPRTTTIRVYNNNSLVRTLNSDRYGNWSFEKLPLKEGKNTLTIQAYSIDKDASLNSDPVLVTSDSEPPVLTTKVTLDGTKNLKITVEGQEALSTVKGQFEGRSLVFKEDAKALVWTASIPLPPEFQSNAVMPNKLKSLSLTGTDKAGNQTENQVHEFFVAVTFPQDKMVHYKDDIRFIGKSSKMVKSLMLNSDTVYVDPKQNFSSAVRLKPGKNLVKLKVKTLDDNDITYTTRVLRLVTFPDLDKTVKERREIEFLATLGILDGDEDGKFYPNRTVTRRYITRMMVKVKKFPVDQQAQSLFPDVPSNDPDAAYIQTAIQNGLIFAYPDGTFKPDQPLTLSEALFLLSNSGIVDETQVTDENQYITRRELAQYLAYTPRYEIQIERLIDWEKGY